MKYIHDINNLWAAKVSLNDQFLYSRGNGNEKYELASLSKAFTALSIVLLSVEGKISLDDDVAIYNTDFVFKDKNNKVHPVTFRNLLQHTSGLDGHTIRFQESGDINILQTANRIVRTRLVSVPNKKYCYATGGYVVLGALVELISGMSFSDFVQEKIFHPFQMYSSDASGKALEGYKLGLWGYRPVIWKGCKAFTPAGYISSTVDDMLLFLRAFANDIFPNAEIAKAIRICRDTRNYVETDRDNVLYGFGWFWDRELDMYYHDGCNPGFSTYMSYQNRETKSFSIWLLNCNEGIFSKNAELYVEAFVKNENKNICLDIPNHFFKKLLFYIELIIVLLILKSNIHTLWWLLSSVVLLSGIISKINGNLNISQIYLWTDILKLGIAYNSLFLGGIGIFHVLEEINKLLCLFNVF